MLGGAQTGCGVAADDVFLSAILRGCGIILE
jgi:hypothetical protein